MWFYNFVSHHVGVTILQDKHDVKPCDFNRHLLFSLIRYIFLENYIKEKVKQIFFMKNELHDSIVCDKKMKMTNSEWPQLKYN